MNKLTKNKKKKGFTLIELIAVIAIIGILAAVLVPRVVGYMNDARDSKIIAQARNVLMAYETINSKEPASFTATDPSVSDVAGIYSADATSKAKWGAYFQLEASNYDMLNENATMTQLKTATDSGSVSGIKKTN